MKLKKCSHVLFHLILKSHYNARNLKIPNKLFTTFQAPLRKPGITAKLRIRKF